MVFCPDIFLIGAQKAGTTTLATLLDSFPNISLSRPKEPHFFTKNYHLGFDWYAKCFDNKDNILIDASTSYTQAFLSNPEAHAESPLMGVPERIKAANANAKFIYIVRDPVDRAYSGYWHAVRVGDESRPFEEAIRATSHYLDQSDYAGQIELYLRHFKLENFLIIRLKDLNQNPRETLARCASFLEIDHSQIPDNLNSEAKNVSYRYNKTGRVISKILNERGIFKKLTKQAKKTLPKKVYLRLGNLLTQEIPDMRKETRAELRQKTEASVKRFEAISGVRFQ
ncbi:sulfotransferase domain-containing protein [Motiliproteus sp. SC1-56]|uniref:sulfotransferase domain-containing protein n=1 Tax=Motiliproteus sp. SC1-56 TaxID=2799565 RepID=UPI001A8E62B4|nr:sulfotransferase domain-containing protein [Motiliproteus sp. SC1-56]